MFLADNSESVQCSVQFRLLLPSVQYDVQHDFAGVTNEADCAIVLGQLEVDFFVEA